MKVYLVGGAVRDQLLGLAVKERDWVVVGATKEELLNKKFRQVGRDFPVFLHPKTQEEYALARTERKTAPGYYGFDCDFSASVTLEEDLARRDLTINAIAQDEDGKLIDPYQGILDLNNKILRHISPAFAEDPVRVLRVARFAARFYRLGFRLANETRVLMYAMVKRGELAHLVAERVWQEWQRSLEEQNPEQFILCLRSCDALSVVLPEINALFGVPNAIEEQKEIDTGMHSLMALKAATVLTSDPITRFAALMHEVGKASTPACEWPKHPGYEESGVLLINALCLRLKIPNDYHRLASIVARFHLIIHNLLDLSANTVVDSLEQTDAFRRPYFFNQLLIACQADADASGRSMGNQRSKQWGEILAQCVTVSPQILIAQGYEGKAIGEALHAYRVARVQLMLTAWNSNEK